MRGTRSKPRVYVSFKDGLKEDGAPRYVMRAAPGCRTKRDGELELARIELAISRGEQWEHGNEVVTDLGQALERFAVALTNKRAYEDRLIIRNDLVPRWKGHRIADVNVRDVIAWLDDLKRTTMAPQTQRHRYGLLSRFYGWAIEGGLVDQNPCASVPKGRRPPAKRVREPEPLEDTSLVPRLMAALPDGLGLMYYVARFTGMREGEVAGLRMSDVEQLVAGSIRVRYSFNAGLKESYKTRKESKVVPAPADALDVLGLHLKRRKLQGARGEDLVFPYSKPAKVGKVRKSEWAGWAGWHPKHMRTLWRKAARALGISDDVTFYSATRHTYTIESLKAGMSLDEVADALGHADPAVTKRAYGQYVRTEWSPGMRRGLSGAAGTGET